MRPKRMGTNGSTRVLLASSNRLIGSGRSGSGDHAAWLRAAREWDKSCQESHETSTSWHGCYLLVCYIRWHQHLSLQWLGERRLVNTTENKYTQKPMRKLYPQGRERVEFWKGTIDTCWVITRVDRQDDTRLPTKRSGKRHGSGIEAYLATPSIDCCVGVSARSLV